ncbi:hypothetical protein C1H46_025642 [Malus baccata]|uniref:Uncharacterized protein n=1 Tax=Malus baccata TaxID=106549 RepID=A0A540LQI2_MALBA|nr:hypothetical protein C1H46_025642 [Malus baccata]
MKTTCSPTQRPSGIDWPAIQPIKVLYNGRTSKIADESLPLKLPSGKAAATRGQTELSIKEEREIRNKDTQSNKQMQAQTLLKARFAFKTKL